MVKEIDAKKFQAVMNESRPHNPVTEEEATAALRNLGEFVALLYKINEREHIVPVEELIGE